MTQRCIFELNYALLPHREWQGLLRRDIGQTIESAKHLKHLFEPIARGLHLYRILRCRRRYDIEKFLRIHILHNGTHAWGVHDVHQTTADWAATDCNKIDCLHAQDKDGDSEYDLRKEDQTRLYFETAICLEQIPRP
jgi:hypothetical protein